MAVKARYEQKHDVEANWKKAVDFVPRAGEIIVYDPDAKNQQTRLKMGNGRNRVNDLPFYVDAITQELVAKAKTMLKIGKLKEHIDFSTGQVTFFEIDKTDVYYLKGEGVYLFDRENNQIW